MTGPIASVLRPGGPAAHAIAELSWVLIAGSVAVFFVVVGMLAWALIGNTGRALRGSRQSVIWIVGGGIAFPVTVLSALLLYATVRTADLAAMGTVESIVSVTGHMWWWQVRYRDPTGGGDIVLANEIHLQAGHPVTVGLGSADVIHSFWVPGLAGKVDTVPGRVHQMRLEATTPGLHRGQCAEFCGAQHARMALHVVVHESADYKRWLAAQSRPASAPTDAAANSGMAVFFRERCPVCHQIRGLTGQADAGPDLTHVGSRLFLGAGNTPADKAGFIEWVAKTQHLKPGARMPEYGRLDAVSLDTLADFLTQLK